MNEELKRKIAAMSHDEVQARLSQIKLDMDKDGADIDALTDETQELLKRDSALRDEANKRNKLLDDVSKGIDTKPATIASGKEERVLFGMTHDELEQRGKDLLNKRTVLVSGGTMMIPSHESNLISEPFNEVSTLVDQIPFDYFPNGESYEEPYVKTWGTAGITDEGAEYTETEPVFDSVDMTKIKVTAFAQFSEETKKLPAADYAAKIIKGCYIALKKKLSQQMIAGTGTKQMMGIFGTPKTIEASKDIEIEAIDADTLDKVRFAYGGDEDVTSPLTLILNKDTLAAFNAVRHPDGRKVYDIDFTNKTIDSVSYVINSNVKSFEKASVGDFVLAYGDLSAYKAVQFSEMEMKMTDSHADNFKKGLDAYRISVFVAGNVVKQGGFVRVKKKNAE